MSDLDNELKERCKCCKDELTKVNDGCLKVCSDCDGMLFENHNKKCPKCGSKDINVATMRDYFLTTETYDVSYTIDQHLNYKSVHIALAVGGPSIYVDTEARAVQGRWGSECVDLHMEDELVDSIDNCWEEFYNDLAGKN